MAQITKFNTVPIANIGKVNGITLANVEKINGTRTTDPDIPTGLIVPYTAGSGGAPSGWTMYTAADGYYLVGAGSSYAVDATGGSNSFTANYSTNSAHTGSTQSIPTVSDSGGWYRDSSSTGAHTHSATFTWTPPYQTCYLIKANAGQTEFPTDSVVWTYGSDKSTIGNVTNIWTGGNMFMPNSSNTTAGSNTINDTTTSGGAHSHGTLASGNGSGSGAAEAEASHIHSVTITMTNTLYQQALAAWSDAVAAVDLSSYGANIIGLYENTTPPDDWYLCDGNNSTPDMRDYFVKCTTQVSAGVSSGNGTATATDASEAHAAHSHKQSNEDGGGAETAYHDTYTESAHSCSDNDSHTPSYYALAFIMYGG